MGAKIIKKLSIGKPPRFFLSPESPKLSAHQACLHYNSQIHHTHIGGGNTSRTHTPITQNKNYFFCFSACISYASAIFYVLPFA